LFREVSNWIDVIEDIEEDPEAGQILSTYEGEFSLSCYFNHSIADDPRNPDACKSYQLTWAIREASERNRKVRSAPAAAS
jgi:hypothetical protein